MSSTVKVTPRNERYRKVTNIFGRNCCSRLLTIAHDFSRSLIFFDRYIVAIFAENVLFEVLGPYFLGPLCYMLTIAHDCSRLLTIAHDCSRFMCARWLLALASKFAFWPGVCTRTCVQQCKPQARSRIAILVELSKPGLRCGAKNVMMEQRRFKFQQALFFNALAIYGHDVATPLAK